MKYVKLFLGALALQIVGCIAGFYLSRDLRIVLSEEDFLVENLSALFFLVGGVYGGWCLWRRIGHRWAFLLITTLGVVGFLDEISFGQRLFGISMPTIAGVDVDGVHDLVRIPLRPLRQWLKTSPSGFIWVMAIVFVITTILLAVALTYREKLRAGLRLVMARAEFAAWSVFASLLAVAFLLDERLIRFDVVAFLEEPLEMNAALALILVAFCTSRVAVHDGTSSEFETLEHPPSTQSR